MWVWGSWWILYFLYFLSVRFAPWAILRAAAAPALRPWRRPWGPTASPHPRRWMRPPKPPRHECASNAFHMETGGPCRSATACSSRRPMAQPNNRSAIRQQCRKSKSHDAARACTCHRGKLGANSVHVGRRAVNIAAARAGYRTHGRACANLRTRANMHARARSKVQGYAIIIALNLPVRACRRACSREGYVYYTYVHIHVCMHTYTHTHIHVYI